MSPDLNNAFAYLKHIELGAAAEQAPQGSPMSVGSHEAAMPARLFSHEAAVFYLVDEGDNFSYVQDRHLEEAGMTADQLNAIGIANLERLFESLQVNENAGMMMFSGSGNFEASLLLVPSLWDTKLAARFPNGPVAAIPSRDVLAVCDRDDAGAVARLAQASAAVWANNGDHLLAKDLYARDAKGAWVTLGNESESPTTTPAPAAATVDPNAVEEIVISNDELTGGGGVLNTEQIHMMANSGYGWNPDTQCFHRVHPGDPGAPARPWETPAWGPAKKAGFLSRFRK